MAKHYLRHVLLCSDTGREGCASAKKMRKAWKRLEKAVAKAGLKKQVLCTRTECFGVCEGGPILSVNPDGVWYGACDDEAIDRIVKEHLAGGRVVGDLALRMRTGLKRSS